MKKIYLIRHGRTIANEKWLYCGVTDLSLSESGVKELETIKYTVPKDCIFLTSGMKRTEQTLRILFGDVSYKTDERFREMDFGIFEMKSYDELKYKAEYQQWINGDNEKNIAPEGESGEQMQKRVLDGLKSIKNMNQNIVLITHGGVIAAIMEYLFPEEEKNRYLWQPRPGCGYVITNGKYQELTNENVI